MRFLLHFILILREEIIDADRIGLANFLKKMGLKYQAESGELCDLQQQALCFDGH